MPLKKILTSVYTLNPFANLEVGASWHFIYQIARYQKVIVITPSYNEEVMNIYMLEFPDPLYENIQFEYFDHKNSKRKYKKSSFLDGFYEILWHRAVPEFVNKQQLKFDIVHQFTDGSAYGLGYLWKLNKPFVWGPIGHMPLIPNQYLRVYKKTRLIKDRFNWLIKKMIWKFSPNLRQTISRADHILCMNQNAATLLKDKNTRFSILPTIAAHDKGYTINFAPESFTLISAGKLVPEKGFDLSILAFADFLSGLNTEEKAKTKLLIVGNGPELALFKNMVSENKIEKNVEFIESLKAEEFNLMLRNSSAFIFPSHYGSGMEVAEALSAGIPIIRLDNSGNTNLITDKCGFTISSGDYSSTIAKLSQAIKVLHSNKKTLLSMSLNARERFESSYDWNVRGVQLKKIYFNM